MKLALILVCLLNSAIAHVDPYFVGQPALSMSSSNSSDMLVAIANFKVSGVKKSTGDLLFEITPMEGAPRKVVFSPTRNEFVVVSYRRFFDPNDWTSTIYRSRVDSYSASTLKILWSYTEDSGEPRSLGFSADGSMVLLETMSPRNGHITINLIESSSGKSIKKLSRDDIEGRPSIEFADFYGNNKLVLTTYYGQLLIYDLDKQSISQKVELIHITNNLYYTRCSDLKIAPDLKSLVVAISTTDSRQLFKVDLEKSQVAWKTRTGSPGMSISVRSLAWPSNKSATFFVAMASGWIQEFNAETGKTMRSFGDQNDFDSEFRSLFVSDNGEDIFGLHTSGYIKQLAN